MAKARDTNCTVISKQWLTHDVFQLTFDVELENLEFKAGQFVSVIIPGAGPNGRDLRRAYSIASSPEQKQLELCIKWVKGGSGSTYLKELKEGSTFKAQLPFGDFVYRVDPEKNAVFIATGTGIAPFRSIIRSENFKKNKPKEYFLLFGVRETKDLLYENEWEQLHCVPTLSRPDPSWKYHRGRVTHLLKNSLPVNFDFKKSHYYLCGNGAMIDEIKEILINEKGVEKTLIHQEVYYKPKN